MSKVYRHFWAGEVVLLKRTDDTVETVFTLSGLPLIDAIEIGSNTLLVGGDGFINLYVIGWWFTAPFEFQRIWSQVTPVAPDSYAAAAKGLSGVIDTEADVSTGSLGYTAFTWGGYKGFFNVFVSQERNRPNQTCKIEIGVGVVFVPSFTGDATIVASLSLNGEGVGQAGPGALDYVAKFFSWPVPFLGPSKTLFPTVATAKNHAFLRIDNLTNYSDLQNLGVASAILFPSHMEVSYEGTDVTITSTVFVTEGKPIAILVGLTSELKSWGNASMVVKFEDARLNYISVTKG